MPTAQTAAALALLPQSLTHATRIKYIQAINAIPAAIWAKLSFLHIYATDNTPNSVIDLTGNGNTATLTGVQNFMPRVGYQGDGSTFYINSNWTPSTEGGSLNDASRGVMIANNRTVNQTWADLGGAGSGSNLDWIFALFSDGKAYGSISGAGSTGATNSVGTKGLWISSRQSSTTLTVYKDGAAFTSGANTSGAQSSRPILILAGYVSGASGTVSNFSADTAALAFGGLGLSASEVATLSSALAVFMPASVPATLAEAWGFTRTTFGYTPASIAEVDTGLTNGAGFTWYATQFWGEGNPSGSDFTVSGGKLIANASMSAAQYRARLSTRGNSSSTFSGSISGTTLVVNTMLGVVATHGGASYTNPVAVGQRICGANMGISQPLSGPLALEQLTGTPGGVGTYRLDTSFGNITAQVFNGYSDVGLIPRFQPGGLFEFVFSFDPLLTPAAFGGGDVPDHPTFEMVGINSLWGRQFENVSHSTKMHAGEIDFLEVYPGVLPGIPSAYLLSVVDETVPTDYADWNLIVASPNSLTTAQMGSPAFTNPNTFQVLWVPATMNGGVGLIYRYINGVRISSMDIQYATGGTLSILDTDEMVLQMDGGYHQPVNLHSCTVKQV